MNPFHFTFYLTTFFYTWKSTNSIRRFWISEYLHNSKSEIKLTQSETIWAWALNPGRSFVGIGTIDNIIVEIGALNTSGPWSQRTNSLTIWFTGIHLRSTQDQETQSCPQGFHPNSFFRTLSTTKNVLTN